MQTVVGLVVCLAAGPGAVLPRNAECKLGRLARKRTLYDLIIQNTTLAPIRRECAQRRFHQGVVTFGRGFKESAVVSLTVSRS